MSNDNKLLKDLSSGMLPQRKFASRREPVVTGDRVKIAFNEGLDHPSLFVHRGKVGTVVCEYGNNVEVQFDDGQVIAVDQVHAMKEDKEIPLSMNRKKAQRIDEYPPQMLVHDLWNAVGGSNYTDDEFGKIIVDQMQRDGKSVELTSWNSVPIIIGSESDFTSDQELHMELLEAYEDALSGGYLPEDDGYDEDDEDSRFAGKNERRFEYTAFFTADDFDRWFLAGSDYDDIVTPEDEEDLYDNCLYLAKVEGRVLLQSSEELKTAISNWADEWNSNAKIKDDEDSRFAGKNERRADIAWESGPTNDNSHKKTKPADLEDDG